MMQARIGIIMTIDANGVLTVSAKEGSNRASIVPSSQRLTREAIERMVQLGQQEVLGRPDSALVCLPLHQQCALLMLIHETPCSHF